MFKPNDSVEKSLNLYNGEEYWLNNDLSIMSDLERVLID